MKRVSDTTKKRIKRALLSRLLFGDRSLYSSLFSWAQTTALLMAISTTMTGILLADEGGITPDAEGNVTLYGNENDYFAESLTISGATTSSLTFKGVDNHPYPFENRGTIGVDGVISEYVNQITAEEIGKFTNAASGAINFTTGFSTSSLENNGSITTTEGTLNTGVFNNNKDANVTLSSGLIKADSLSNDGIIDGGTNIQAVTITNSGTIRNTNIMTTAISSEGLLTNSGTITGLDTINTFKLINNEGATLGNTDKIFSIYVSNNGQINDVGEIYGILNNYGSVQFTGDHAQTMTIGTLNALEEGELYVQLFTAGQGATTVSGTDNDLYEVTTVQIHGGTIVLTDDHVTGTFSAGDKYTVLTSSKEFILTGELSVDSSSVTLAPRLAFRTSNDDFNYYVEVVRNSDYGEQGNTNNQRQFGSYIDTIGANAVPGSDLDNVMATLDSLSPGNEITPAAWLAMAQMDGAIYGSMATMEVQNMTIVNNTLTNYLRPKDVFGCNCSCADPCHQSCPGTCQDLNMWGTYYGVDGYAESDGNTFGGDYSISGVLVGGDRALTQNFRLGGFFAFGDTEYQVNGLNEQANADSYKAGLYFVRNAGNGYLLGNFNYGWDNFRMTRNITFLDRTNTAKTSGSEWAFRVEKGFNCPLASSVFQPFGAFQYLSLNTNAFSEEGTGATALNVDEADYNSYRSEFGGRLLWAFEGQRRTGNLFLQASWMHEYGDTCGTVSSSFNNANNANYTGNSRYTVNGVDLGSDWCNLGVGGNITHNNLTVFGGYDFMINESQNLHTGNAGVAYRF